MKNEPELVLYHSPGACSQVAVYALEKTGLPYRLELVNLAKGMQNDPQFRDLLPSGKVPTLWIDGAPLTENAAIQTYLAKLRPDSSIFPSDPAILTQAETVGGLSFCSATLHPLVRGMINPARITTGDGEGVREMSRKLLQKSLGYAERRLADRGWWLGECSVVDVYLNWAVSVARKAGFDFSDLPNLDNLRDHLIDDPAFVRMLQIEQDCAEQLGLVAR